MTIHISGRTRLAGVLGWPLSHTLSPAMHNAAYEAVGLDWVYVPLPIPDEPSLIRVLSAVKVLPFVGVNVTMPYKESVLSLCDEVAAMAELAGAVNTVHVVDGRLIGYNTDGRGLLEALAAEVSFEPGSKRVVVLGAGGAAAAAAVTLVLSRAASVTILNRTLDRGTRLVDRLSSRARETELRAIGLDGEGEQAVREADLIVNATPVGMKADDESPLPASWLNADQVIADMVYRPGDTALVRLAREEGARAVGGLGMLVSQGAISAEIWDTDSEACMPRDVMRAVAERGLDASEGEHGRA